MWVYRNGSSTNFIAKCRGKYLGVHETAEGAACLVETYLKSADAPQPTRAAANRNGYEGVYERITLSSSVPPLYTLYNS